MTRMHLEILDEQDLVIATHKLKNGLILVGQSPSADVHLTGPGIGALHVAIKSAKQQGPIIMDLGGPTPVLVNGKPTLEYAVAEEATTFEVGKRKLRLKKVNEPFTPLQNQVWQPVADEKNTEEVIRLRLYSGPNPSDIQNVTRQFLIPEQYGLAAPFRMVWREGGQYKAQLPKEWINFGGRLRIGKGRVGKLSEWETPVSIEKNIIYRVFAGPYVLELLIANGAHRIAHPSLELLPKELRKPLIITFGLVIAILSLWTYLMSREPPKVEEPYPVYARIQNVPIEVMPEPTEGEKGGGGSGAAPANVPQGATKLATSLTSGLRGLFGKVLSKSQSNAVVSEGGLGTVTASQGVPMDVGKLTSVGKGAEQVAGAAKLGKLALKGSGEGFSGGSGTGLGTGIGSGIGSGVGAGIGTSAGYKVVEEESFVDGGLDKSLIAAVIQNNLSQIKYCYERQLVADPNLFGKVVATWTINDQGLVERPTIKQTTLSSTPVEQCIISKISGWKFAKPKNGSKVTVSYPFLFKSTK